MQADWELSQSFTSDGQGVQAACVLPPDSDDSANEYRIVAGTQGGSLWEFGVPSGNLIPIEYQHNIPSLQSLVERISTRRAVETLGFESSTSNIF